MKRFQKLLLACAILMSCGAYSGSAQIYVHIRPIGPVIIRSTQPSPRHIWVNEDWRERDGRYEYSGGHWAEPPHEGSRYREGRWKHDRRGDTWKPGGWGNDNRRRNDRHNDRHDNGRHEGHNNKH